MISREYAGADCTLFVLDIQVPKLSNVMHSLIHRFNVYLLLSAAEIRRQALASLDAWPPFCVRLLTAAFAQR